MSSEAITKDAISILCNLSNPPSQGFAPVVQLIDLQKKIPAKKPQQVVWRLVLSDSSYFCEGALGSNLYSLIDGGLLSKYYFIKLMKYNATTIGKTIVVVVQDLEILDNPGGVWCSPTRFEPSLDEPERERQRNEPVSLVKNYFLTLCDDKCPDVDFRFRVCDDCGCAPCEFIGRGVEVMSFVNAMDDKENLQLTNRQKRFLCYTGYSAYKHGYLGKYNRIKLPACVEEGIKNHYEEMDFSEYTGFRTKDEEEVAAPRGGVLARVLLCYLFLF